MSRWAAVLVPDDPAFPAALAVGAVPPCRGTVAAPVTVSVYRAGAGAPAVDRHLRVRLPAPHPSPSLADVLIGPVRSPGGGAGPASGPGSGGGAARAALAGLVRDHPGALVTAVSEGPRCWARLGTRGSGLLLAGRYRLPGAARRPRTAGSAWAIWVSLLHAWLVAGFPAAALASAAAAPVRRPGPAPVRAPARFQTCGTEPGSAPEPESEGALSTALLRGGPPMVIDHAQTVLLRAFP